MKNKILILLALSISLVPSKSEIRANALEAKTIYLFNGELDNSSYSLKIDEETYVNGVNYYDSNLVAFTINDSISEASFYKNEEKLADVTINSNNVYDLTNNIWTNSFKVSIYNGTNLIYERVASNLSLYQTKDIYLEGYNFNGLYYDSELTNLYSDVILTRDTTLYASFIKQSETTYRCYFDNNATISLLDTGTNYLNGKIEKDVSLNKLGDLYYVDLSEDEPFTKIVINNKELDLFEGIYFIDDNIKAIKRFKTNVSLRMKETLGGDNTKLYLRITNDANCTTGAYIQFYDSSKSSNKTDKILLTLDRNDGEYTYFSLALNETYLTYDAYKVYNLSGGYVISGLKKYQEHLNTSDCMYSYSYGNCEWIDYYTYSNIGIRFGMEKEKDDFLVNLDISDITYKIKVSYLVGEDEYEYITPSYTLANNKEFYQGAYGVFLSNTPLPGLSSINDNYSLTFSSTIILTYNGIDYEMLTSTPYTLKTLVDTYISLKDSLGLSSEIVASLERLSEVLA